MNIKPLSDRVLIEPMAVEAQTASGIIIPDTAKEKPQRAIVLEVGPGKDGKPLQVKPHDQVIYNKYAGATEIDHEGVKLLIVREEDLLAIISK